MFETKVLMGIGTGLLFGGVTAISGVFKNRKEPNFKPQWSKAIPTIIITTVAGGIAGANDMPMTVESLTLVTTGLATVGATEWITNTYKGVKEWWNNR